jgi:hypothetical protein
MATGTQRKVPEVAAMSSLLIACAASLSRSGHFDAAKSFLNQIPLNPAAQDLLARIHLQSGAIDDARNC